LITTSPLSHAAEATDGTDATAARHAAFKNIFIISSQLKM
jgi:hypothetical protein